MDVYASGSNGVVLLGQRILVLETSNSAAGVSSRGSLTWITLAVTQESVEELLNASKAGKLYITLPGASVEADAGAGAEADAGASAEADAGAGAPEAGELHD